MSVPIQDLRNQLAAWRAERIGGTMLPRPSVEAALTLAEVVLEGAGDAGSGGAGGLLHTLDLLDVAHRPESGKMLGPAESLAWELVADVSQRVGSQGWAAAAPAVLPPVAWMEPVPSPLMWRRDLRLPVPSLAGFESLRLPFALIVVPSDHLRLPWRLATVAHEVGHALDAAFGLGARARAACAARKGAKELDRRWLGDWLGELVADLVGLAGVGPVFGDVLRFVVQGLASPSADGDRSHPPLAQRLALLRAAWSVLGGVEDRLEDVDAAIAEDARALVGPDVMGLAPVLRRGPAGGSWGELPRRALEAAGGVVGGKGAEPTGEEAEARGWSVFQPPPELAPHPGQETLAALRSFWISRVPRLAPTSLELTGSMLKRPPPALFGEYEELFLVGATHRSLIGALEAGLVARGGRKWRRIEVFFLGRDEDLPRIYEGEKTDFVPIRNEVRRRLPEALAGVAEQSFVGNHPSCTLFASFLYQPPEPGLEPARWYVHTSAAVWGQSIAVAPSADYRSVSGDLSGDPEIRTLLEGLRHLRREAGCALPFPGAG